MKKFGSKSGFTLVELIVVIAILGILAGIAVPAYSGYIKKANEAADYTQLDAIKTAAVFAYTDKQVKDGKYDEVDVAEINVTGEKASATVTVTPPAAAGATTAANPVNVTEGVKDYYDLANFEFKSGAGSATWRKTATTSEAAGWTLTPKTTNGGNNQPGTGTPGENPEKP